MVGSLLKLEHRILHSRTPAITFADGPLGIRHGVLLTVLAIGPKINETYAYRRAGHFMSRKI